MTLEGLHHITAITADAQRTLDFHVRVLGLRLVKRTVNFDQPDVHHLYFGDHAGTPGSILTFFEYPGAIVGRAGDGMVHTILWRVGSADTVAFWRARLAAAGVETTDADGGALRFADPEGLAHELVVDDSGEAPLAASAPDVPAAHALRGFAGVRVFTSFADDAAATLEALGFVDEGDGAWVVRGASRSARYLLEAPPERARVGRQAAGTIHHIAWSVADDAELEALSELVTRAGLRPTPIMDRQYFHSVYFREPTGVLFELASRDIGFTVDEPTDALGTTLRLPPQLEPLREELEEQLTPLTMPGGPPDGPSSD